MNSGKLLLLCGMLLGCGFGSFAQAREIPPADCMEALFRRGGLSIAESRELCAQSSNDVVLDCQNGLFLQAGFNPKEALNACIETPSRRFAQCVVEKAGAWGWSQSQARSFCSREDLSRYTEYFQVVPNFAPTTSGVVDVRKPTVCSITINSNDEIEVFRKTLAPQGFDFVELVPDWQKPGNFIPRDDRWLSKTCPQVPRCDVLVVSGHFAGVFLGKAGFEVDLKEMQKLSCSQSCPGLFQQVKEVYLFGCNTLANKEPDTRSFDQYRQILVEDGLSVADAEIAASRRYTPYGRSFLDNMQALFPGAKAIHGFSSVSPSGPNITSALSRVLSKRGDYQKYLRDLSSKPTWWEKEMADFSPRTTVGSAELNERLCSLQGYAGREAMVKQLGNSLEKNELQKDAIDLATSSITLSEDEVAGIKNRYTDGLNTFLRQSRTMGRNNTPVLGMNLLAGLEKTGLVSAADIRAQRRQVMSDVLKGKSPDWVAEITCLVGFGFDLSSTFTEEDFADKVTTSQKAKIKNCIRHWN